MRAYRATFNLPPAVGKRWLLCAAHPPCQRGLEARSRDLRAVQDCGDIPSSHAGCWEGLSILDASFVVRFWRKIVSACLN